MKYIEGLSNDERFVYQLDDGRKVFINLEDERVSVSDEKNKEIGYLSFNQTEMPIGAGNTDFVYKLTHAYLEEDNGSYKRKGIMTKAFRLFSWNVGQLIELSDDNGMKHSDGSHLTGEGVPFVDSLRKITSFNFPE